MEGVHTVYKCSDLLLLGGKGFDLGADGDRPVHKRSVHHRAQE
jgi:hypothetical protein